MLEAQLTVASLDIHGLVMCQLHCFPIMEIFFPLHCPFALDRIYFCCLFFLFFASLGSSFLSLLFCTLSVYPFFSHLQLNFLLELLLPLLKRLFPFHGFLNCLLRFNSIINFLLGLFFSLLQDIDPSVNSVIGFESLRKLPHQVFLLSYEIRLFWGGVTIFIFAHYRRFGFKGILCIMSLESSCHWTRLLMQRKGSYVIEIAHFKIHLGLLRL